MRFPANRWCSVCGTASSVASWARPGLLCVEEDGAILYSPLDIGLANTTRITTRKRFPHPQISATAAFFAPFFAFSPPRICLRVLNVYVGGGSHRSFVVAF